MTTNTYYYLIGDPSSNILRAKCTGNSRVLARLDDNNEWLEDWGLSPYLSDNMDTVHVSLLDAKTFADAKWPGNKIDWS